MLLSNRRKKVVLVAVISLFVTLGFGSDRGEITELAFARPPVSDSDISRTLQSVVKVQGEIGLYQDALYLMTHFGDREEIFQKENQNAIDTPWRNDTWRYCSVFSTRAGGDVLMGRNWDNQNVGSIIVSLYHPPGGYTSVSFSRAIDLGFPLNLDLEQIKSSELGKKLILAPYYAMDGINEHGLAVAVAGVSETTHKPKEDKKLVFVTFLVRRMLDRTKTIEEAVNLAGDFIPFDLDRNSLNTHFFIVDFSGRSVILEYVRDQWRKTFTDLSWQVLTNRPVSDVPDDKLRTKCWRYRSISEILEKTRGNVDRRSGMNIMRKVSQKGTTWSVVYSPTARDLIFSVYQKWDTIYHLNPFQSGGPSK